MKRAGASITWISEPVIKEPKDYKVVGHIFKKIKIHPILCNNISETEGNFRWMANETGGSFFYLKEISDLSDLLTGICLKETGKLPYFERKLLANGNKVPVSKKLLFLQLKDGAVVKRS